MKSFTTTNLVGHLRKHPTEFRKFEDEKSAAASNTEQQARKSKKFKQVTLEESSSRTKAWDFDDKYLYRYRQYEYSKIGKSEYRQICKSVQH